MLSKNNGQKLISIIVPIYNAASYLGYTLSSLIRQSYVNLEIILVNDGSTDDSLKICQNYARIDSRIQIINLKNQGVSHARNIGIQAAKGEYLQFVDSDDVIASDMSEKMVAAMEKYDTDLVICGMKSVQLEEKKVVFFEDWTPRYIGKECVLTKEDFLASFTPILLYTVLLEGPCNKLYKKKLLDKYVLTFPENKTLGEDFVYNLSYFGKIKSVSFISDVLYDYLQWNDDSLTKCYREDLFVNQIDLLNKLEQFLLSEDVWNEQNEICFYRYAAGHMTKCLRALGNSLGTLNEEEVKKQLFQMLRNDNMRKWIAKVDWIDEDFLWIKQCVKYTDVGTAYEKLCDLKTKCQKDIIINEEKKYYPGRINLFLESMLRRINVYLKKQSIKKVIIGLQTEGIKTTFKKAAYSFQHKIAKRIPEAKE